METDGGGWTVFQRRMDGTQDSYLDWSDYVRGFGELSREFWLGLSQLERLTKVPTQLRVDLEDLTMPQGLLSTTHSRLEARTTTTP